MLVAHNPGPCDRYDMRTSFQNTGQFAFHRAFVGCIIQSRSRVNREKGSQSNVISQMALLTERNIKFGDIVQVLQGNGSIMEHCTAEVIRVRRFQRVKHASHRRLYHCSQSLCQWARQFNLTISGGAISSAG